MRQLTRRFLLTGAAALSDLPAASRVGAALYGTRHSHAKGKWKAILENPSFQPVGVCEPDDAAWGRAPELHSSTRLSEEQMLGDPSIQLVVVETEVWNAMDYARKVIAAGKHLHLEKPPTHQMAPFRELVEEARRRNLKVQLGYIWRFHQGIAKAIELARSGELGHVHLMRGAIHTNLQPQARAPLARYKGGMMFELGCHLIDRAVDLFGRPADVRSWLKKGSDGLAENAMAVLEYKDALAVITTSAKMAGSSHHRSFEVIGSDGSVLVQPVEPGVRMRVLRDRWEEIELPPQPRYVGDFQDMARAIQSRSPLRFSYDFELLVQETLLRASQEMG